jgi:hypothetical protein
MGDAPQRPGDPADREPADLRPLGALADLAELLGGDSERSRRFMGGLVAGALVGAAIAGAALLRRGAAARADLGRRRR